MALIAMLAATAIPTTQAYAAIGGGGGKAGGASLKSKKPSKDATPIAANTDEKWYVELTPSYITTGADVDKFWGATVALGYRLTQEDKFQFEIGYYRSDSLSAPLSFSRSIIYNTILPSGQPGASGQTGALTLKGTKNMGSTKAIPVMLSYSYCIPFWSNRLEFRLTPAAGIMIVTNGAWNTSASGGFSSPDGGIINNVFSSIDGATPDGVTTNDNISDGTVNQTEAIRGRGSNNNVVVACGGGIGLTYNVTPRTYVDIGYRYLWTAKVQNNPNSTIGWNGVAAWNGMNIHQYTLTLGWKF